MGLVRSADVNAMVDFDAVDAEIQRRHLGYVFDATQPFKVPHELEKLLVNTHERFRRWK